MKTTNTPKLLKGLFNLDHNIKVYIPSTNHADVVDTSQYINQGLSKFSKYFGGSTSYEAIGSWLSREVGLIREKITIVEAYGTKEQMEAHLSDVIAFCEYLKKDLNQEAISLEYDNKLFFI